MAKEFREIIQTRDYLGMAAAEGILQNSQRAEEERLRLRILALLRIQRRKIIQAQVHVGMVGPERLPKSPVNARRTIWPRGNSPPAVKQRKKWLFNEELE